MSVFIRNSEIHDAAYLAPRLREIDIQEIYCTTLLPPLEALEQAYNTSDICQTAVVKGAPIAMFGAAVVPWGAVPWLLGTPDIVTVKLSMAKLSNKWVNDWVQTYGLLKNYVHSSNEVSIRWLQDHLEFTMASEPTFFNHQPFLAFERSHLCAIPL